MTQTIKVADAKAHLSELLALASFDRKLAAAVREAGVNVMGPFADGD